MKIAEIIYNNKTKYYKYITEILHLYDKLENVLKKEVI